MAANDNPPTGAPTHTRVNVATAGTKVQLSTTSLEVKHVTVSGDPANTAGKYVAVGGSGVVAAAGAGRRALVFLGPNDVTDLDVAGDLSNWWVDADADNQALLVTYWRS